VGMQGCVCGGVHSRQWQGWHLNHLVSRVGGPDEAMHVGASILCCGRLCGCCCLPLPADLQGRWNRYEQELAAASEQQVLSMEQGKASKQQIFSRWAGVMCVDRQRVCERSGRACCCLLTSTTGAQAAAGGLGIRVLG
jgi:hypothetical protein